MMLPKGYKYFKNHYKNNRTGFQKEGCYFIPIGKDAKDGYAIVDVDDSAVERYKWRLDSHGYPVTTVTNDRGVRTNLSLHHLIAGKPKKGLVVDHINRNKLDCRKDNLRFVSHSYNSFNRTQTSKSRNPYPGIKQTKYGWNVEIRKDNVYYYVGFYKDLDVAIDARREVEEKLYNDSDGSARVYKRSRT